MSGYASPAQLTAFRQLHSSTRYAELLAALADVKPTTETMFLRANALYALEKIPEASETARQILAVEPQHALCLTLLASIANLRGQPALAREYLQTLSPQGPDLPEARLEMAQVLILEKRYAEALTLLSQSQTALTHPYWQARGHLLAGDACDGLAQFRQAYAHYEKKNQFVETWAAQLGVLDHLGAWTTQLTTSLVQHLPMLQGSTTTSPFNHGPTPIFIVGFPRSGTTLLQAKLEAISGVEALEERELWQDSVTRWLDPLPDWRGLANATSNDLAWARACYWQRVEAELGHRPMGTFIDKYPMNCLKLPIIARVFPNARVIYCTREPQACVFSAFRRFIKPSSLTLACSTISKAKALYDGVSEFMQYASNSLPLSFFPLQYERWMQDPDRVFADLVEQLGLSGQDAGSTTDWQAQLATRPHATPSTAQLSQGLTRVFKDQHLSYDFALKPLFAA